MKAIYDQNCNLVGWMSTSDGNVFSDNMAWIGFTKQDCFFSTACKWLGGFINSTFVDKQGKPIAWLQGSEPKSTGAMLMVPYTPLRPITPIRSLRPLTPIRPLKPLTPIGGWSNLDWKQYLNQ